MSQTHRLKITKRYFNQQIKGIKQFELRKNDRNFEVGDTIILLETENEKITGNKCKVKIIDILEHFEGLNDGYCILYTKQTKP